MARSMSSQLETHVSCGDCPCLLHIAWLVLNLDPPFIMFVYICEIQAMTETYYCLRPGALDRYICTLKGLN